MKNLILKACCCLAILQGALAVKAQTSLSLITFNEANATYTQVGSPIQQGVLFNLQPINHSSAVGALSPENNWYTYVGTVGNSSANLYTLNLANASILYTAPATFVDAQGTTLYNNYHYADVISALVGIYTDSTSSSIRSCNIQTGALTTLKTIKKANNWISTYSHVSETFYFKTPQDSFLYSFQPGSGTLDSLKIPKINNYTGGGLRYPTTADLQYDDANGVLYMFTSKKPIIGGGDYWAVGSINLTNGTVTEHYSTPVMNVPVNGLQSYQWAYHAQNSKYLYPKGTSSGEQYLTVVDFNGTTPATMDTTFYMNYPNPAFSVLPQGVRLTHFQYNYLTQQILGLKYADSTHMFPTPKQEICVVTTDSAATHNIVVWEKTDNDAADSFYVYRETSTGIYTRIGAVHGDSLSEYHDYAANPGSTAYRYKLSVTDTFGHEGEMGAYHNTIHVQYLGTGNLSWNQYTINGTTPVTTYDVLCDSLANGNWYVMLSVPGNQTTATDINFANHPNALYRVVANFPFSCTPGRSTNQSYSNVTSQQTVGIAQVNPKPYFSVYPNPANTLVTINTANEWNGATVVVSDVTGRKILSAPLNNTTTTISTENIPAGFYTITLVTTQNGTASKALLIHK
jgi:hypothetical protein